MKNILILIALLLGGQTGFSQQSDRVGLRSGKKVVYAKFGDREVHLDWFRPANEETLPGIVLIHGGGWIGGKREAFETTAKDLAQQGYVVANIDYRLATEAKFPGAVLDCKAAVRWMRAHAESLGLDPERIAAIGGSAGGHLAAMVATTSGDPYFKDETNHSEVADVVQAAIIMGAGVDQVARVKESKGGTIRNCVVFFGGEYSEVPEIYAMGSPITHLSETTPPILMIDGEKDRPGERYGEFRRKLDELGVKNEFQMIAGAKHGEWGKATFRPAFVGAMTAFLEGVFSGKN